MEALSVTSHLTVEDWRAYRRAAAVRFNREFPGFRTARWTALVVICTLVLLALLQLGGFRIQIASLLAGALFMLAVQVLVQRMQVTNSIPEAGGTFLGEVRFEFSPQGIRTCRPGLTSDTQWQRVREFALDKAYLFIWLDRFQAFIVPLRDLNAVAATADAQSRFRAWTNAAGSPHPSAPALASAGRAETWTAVLLRWWTGRSSGPAPLSGAAAPIMVLSLASLLAWSYLDWRVSTPEPEFSVYGIPFFAWYALGVVSLAGLLRWRAYPAPRMDHALVLVLGLAPFLFGLIALPDEQAAVNWVLAAEVLLGIAMTIYLARGMDSITGQAQRFAVLNGMVFVAAFCLISNSLNAVPSFWTVAEPVVADTVADARSEQLLFDQAGRIDQALARIHPGAGVGPAAYFLGFAGVADQKVFAEEVGLAKRVLSERYRIESRSLTLINDDRDLDRAPLATVSGLRYALRGLAGRMNRDDDVLFLAISSHGSQDRAIAVSNAALPLNDLTDDDLADALRQSGIKWRVLIISACYAGGFIDALKDARTIVIAAAAKDRTSFGCTNDRDLTYFGEAFYRDALPAAHSLRAAFETARNEIVRRERAERETPSNPQAYFGQDMESKLAAMEAREH